MAFIIGQTFKSALKLTAKQQKKKVNRVPSIQGLKLALQRLRDSPNAQQLFQQKQNIKNTSMTTVKRKKVQLVNQ